MAWNDSTLNPITTIQIFFLQILHSDTAYGHLSHLAGLLFVAAANCKTGARMKLDVLSTFVARRVRHLQQESIDTARPGHFHWDSP